MTFNLHDYIGSDADTILWWQMCIRAVLIFVVALVLVRLGARRIYGKHGSLDIIIAVILGSILSRALTANAAFLPTLAAAVTLVAVHLLLVKASMYSKVIGHAVKGKEILLIEDGVVREKNLGKANMTRHDLRVALRLQGVESEREVRLAYLERSGEISVIKTN